MGSHVGKEEIEKWCLMALAAFVCADGKSCHNLVPVVGASQWQNQGSSHGLELAINL